MACRDGTGSCQSHFHTDHTLHSLSSTNAFWGRRHHVVWRVASPTLPTRIYVFRLCVCVVCVSISMFCAACAGGEWPFTFSTKPHPTRAAGVGRLSSSRWNMVSEDRFEHSFAFDGDDAVSGPGAAGRRRRRWRNCTFYGVQRSGLNGVGGPLVLLLQASLHTCVCVSLAPANVLKGAAGTCAAVATAQGHSRVSNFAQPAGATDSGDRVVMETVPSSLPLPLRLQNSARPECRFAMSFQMAARGGSN